MLVATPSTAASEEAAPTIGSIASAEAQPMAKALQDSLAEAPAELSTPFEDSGGNTWTTVEQAQEFLAALDESSERVTVETVRQSGQDRPIELVSVGYPSPRSLSEAAEGSVVLFNCSIHGDEPSGREGCMQLARDMATTTDPAWQRLLTSTTVLFLFSNPDGWVADTRENAAGLDVNRDFLALETPEGQAIAQVIRDWKPDVLNDLHEFGPREFYDTQALLLWPRNRNVDDDIRELSVEMVYDYTAPQIEYAGYTTGIYGQLVKDGEPFLQVAGDDQARILRNYTGLNHVTGQLTEAANAALTPEEEADVSVLQRRSVSVQYASGVGTLSMVLENREELAREAADARAEAIQAGADRSGVVYFAGQDDMLPTEEDDVEPNPMCGYQLTANQLDQVSQTMALHGITWETNEDGAYVTMAQEDRPLIPLLLDARSEYGVIQATVVNDC